MLAQRDFFSSGMEYRDAIEALYQQCRVPIVLAGHYLNADLMAFKRPTHKKSCKYENVLRRVTSAAGGLVSLQPARVIARSGGHGHGEQEADKARREALDEVKRQDQSILDDATRDAAAMRDDARAEAEQILRDARADAEEETAVFIKEATESLQEISHIDQDFLQVELDRDPDMKQRYRETVINRGRQEQAATHARAKRRIEQNRLHREQRQRDRDSGFEL